jgi:adenylosuccinate lyase
MPDHTLYESPFVTRYASREMAYLFSPQYKAITWRRLWVALARAEKACGLPVTDKQIHALEDHIHQIDFERIAELEKDLRHDVTAHIHAYGEQCPEAKAILNLGATPTYITDNADLIQMHEALRLLKPKLIETLRHLVAFAEEHAYLPTLSFTHFQPAQPTTVGRRACFWIQDLLLDIEDLEEKMNTIRFLGVKGATGTQSSFLTLFNYDHDKVRQLEHFVAKEMGFTHTYMIASQTYPRKQDMRIFSVLTGIAVSAHKFATDIRLLAHMKEVEEPLASSHAPAFRRSPMRSERICGLARFLISLSDNASYTAANQWLERSLDDSSNRRLAISEGFLAADAILNLLVAITSNLAVYPKTIQHHLNEELPLLASENIIMAAIKKGKDRTTIHERLRLHSLTKTSFLDAIAKDPEIGLTHAELSAIMNIDHFIGRAKEQVDEFLSKEVNPVLKRYHDIKPVIPLPGV